MSSPPGEMWVGGSGATPAPIEAMVPSSVEVRKLRGHEVTLSGPGATNGQLTSLEAQLLEEYAHSRPLEQQIAVLKKQNKALGDWNKELHALLKVREAFTIAALAHHP